MNEPVAWISVLGIDHIGQKFTDVRVSLTKTDVADIPLYTHPAKTLTDEEIQEIAHGFEAIGWMGETTYEFARAILRKAQEK
jgi:hypothetical protein